MKAVCSFTANECIVAPHERIPVGNLYEQYVSWCSLAKRSPVKAMSKYVAVLDVTCEVSKLASLADKTRVGQEIALPILILNHNFSAPDVKTGQNRQSTAE